MRFSISAIVLLSLLASLWGSCARPEPKADVLPVKTEISPDTLNLPAEPDKPPHLETALSFEGVTELTGANDGPDIKRFLAAVGLNAGNPYCAAFISFCLDSARVDRPKVRSGLASHFITGNSTPAREVLRGTVEIFPGTILIWRKGNTIYGHAGFVISQEGPARFTTIEANTGAGAYGNQRDGDGVWRREREIQPGSYFRITDFTRVQY